MNHREDSRDQGHEGTVDDTFFGRESVFALNEKDQQITSTSSYTSNDVHGIEQGRRVLDDTAAQPQFYIAGHTDSLVL
jgi:hypothetical protein